MVQLFADNVDICQICKMIAKYPNVISTVNREKIELQGDLTEDLLKNICEKTQLAEWQDDRKESKVVCEGQKENTNIEDEIDWEETEIPQEGKIIPILDDDEPQLCQEEIEDIQEDIQEIKERAKNHKNPKNELKFPRVKRGEVYFCDFGRTFAFEIGKIRPAIVIQADEFNQQNPSTVVIPCSSRYQNIKENHYDFYFNEKNMADSKNSSIGKKRNVLLTECITSINNFRLVRYIGKMKPEFMDKIQIIIDKELGLKRNIADEDQEQKDDAERQLQLLLKSMEYNQNQYQMISSVDSISLIEILNEIQPMEDKINGLLDLFGFDESKNGYEFVADAIEIAVSQENFNLNTLAKEIYLRRDVLSEEEIKRKIVARVKEALHMKRVYTLEFIRLMKILLTKEVKQNEDES